MRFAKRKYMVAAIIVLLSVLLAYLQFVWAGCNADDADTYVKLYDYFELGHKKMSVTTLLSPWFYCSAVTYLLQIGGTGALSCNVYLSFWYGIAVLFTLLLVMHNRDRIWMLGLAAFILWPYGQTNKYHMVVTFITLFGIWALQCYQDSGKKWILWVVVLVSVYTLVFVEDRMLFLVFWIATLAVYAVILLLQDQRTRKYLYMALFGIILAAAALKCVDMVITAVSGHGTGLMAAAEGYGGAGYYNWIDVETFFNKGIPSLFAALFVQWNIPIEGGMIQIKSLYWIIRIFLACLALVALVCRWRDIIRYGIRDMELLDSLSVVCTTVVLGVNVINGMVGYYRLTNAPINRYASVCWFLLVVIVARWLDERCEGIIFRNISYDLFLEVVFVLLCIGYFSPANSSLEAIKNAPYETELSFLKEHGGQYRYGLGSLWKSKPITATTNAEYVICVGWIEDDRFTYQEDDGFYTDGGNYFNFIVSDVGNEMTISPENVERLRGDYTEIYSSGDTIYGYDYDVRFDPVIVMDTAGMGYELAETIVYSLDLPVGTSRVEITTAQPDNLLLEVLDNDDIADVKIAGRGESIATAEVTCLQNTQIQLSVGRKEDVPTVLYKVEIKRTAGAVDVDVRQTEVPLHAGRYILTFAGENLKDMGIEWDVDGEVTLLDNGRLKRRYLVDIPAGQELGYGIVPNGACLDRIYYENENLFGD